MSDQPTGHQQSDDVETFAGVSTSRRKLVRAGLAAAPVVAAFKTNMVLASGGDKAVCPSTFASFKNNGAMCSVTAPKATTGHCVPMDRCKIKTGTPHNKRKFGSGFDEDGRKGCGFSYSRGDDYDDKQLWELCAMDYASGSGGSRRISRDANRDKLARYVSAAYISCKNYPGTSFVSESQCKDIWENNGSWSPAPGVRWSCADTLEYFDTVYGVRSYDQCLKT